MITVARSEEAVDFKSEIRPILTKQCTACHGGVKEAGNISFIYRGKAMRVEKSGERPIVLGKPEWKRIFSVKTLKSIGAG